MYEANAYMTTRFYWECPICKQKHDWFDEGQFDEDGIADYRCDCCMSDIKLTLITITANRRKNDKTT